MKLRALTLAVILVLVIAGCSTVSISPSPTPEPTHTPVTSQTWAPLPPLPTPRTAAAVAVADGKIYVMGGLDELGRTSTKVEVFDPRSSSWSEASPLLKGLHHAAAVTLDGDSIYLFGGLMGRRGEASDAVYWYNLWGDSWHRMTPMPAARGALTATVYGHSYGDSIYVIGGIEGDGVSSRIDVYFPGIDSWGEEPSLRSGRSHMSAVTVGKLIYIIGGKDETGGTTLDLVEVLDPTNGAWAEVQKLGVGRADFGALEHRGRLYILGGENIDSALDSVEIFDPKTALWHNYQPLPWALHGAATATVDGIAYSIGGSVGPGLSVVGNAYAIALQ